jgi:hypothetical protein
MSKRGQPDLVRRDLDNDAAEEEGSDEDKSTR